MIIPAIDLINGQVVRLYQGDYEQKTEYSSSPQARFDEYVSQGAVQLHLVDLDGAKDAKARQLSLLTQLLSATEAPVQVGGGVRTEQDVADLLGRRCQPGGDWLHRRQIPGSGGQLDGEIWPRADRAGAGRQYR